MIRLALAVGLAVLAGGTAWGLRRRRPDAPTGAASWTVPNQLDRADFSRPAAPWLVAVFSSATCDTCAAVWARAAVLDSEAVAVQNVEARTDRALHERYRIDAVPLVVVADGEGVVRRHFLGPLRAPDLWGALAELRSPGTLPSHCQNTEGTARDADDPAQAGGPARRG